MDKKSQQLGMPFGTATHRLRKIVLFRILSRHGENVCYRCSLPITTVEELSLEHKEAWLDNKVELFWDVENIGFSHLQCNSVERRHKQALHPSQRTYMNGCRCLECKNLEKLRRRDQRARGVKT